MMRRPESTTMDRNHVMQKIYEYYRKSVNNTPIPFQEQQRNLRYKSQSTDTSPVSYASVNTMRSVRNGFVAPSRNADYTIDRKGNYFYTSRPTTATMSSTKSNASRNNTISETDSVFLTENELEGGSKSMLANQIPNDTHYVVVNGEKLRAIDVLKMQQQNRDKRMGALYAEPERIYDVVNGGVYREDEAYGSNINRSQKVIQRPASAMGGSLLYQKNRHNTGRMTPLILQQQQFQPREGDIIINNQVYRPVSTLSHPPAVMSPKLKAAQPQQPVQPIYSTPTRRKTATSYESDSEAGEIQSIMARNYGECQSNFQA